MKFLATEAGSMSVWSVSRSNRRTVFILNAMVITFVELYSSFAAPQRRFSDNEISQARIGGIRTREEIAGFFNGGAVPRGLVRNGILLPTGETLAQVQLRVLGPGFALLNLRGGFRIAERSSVTVMLENILDQNYRTMGSGIDGPGTNAAVRYSFRF